MKNPELRLLSQLWVRSSQEESRWVLVVQGGMSLQAGGDYFYIIDGEGACLFIGPYQWARFFNRQPLRPSCFNPRKKESEKERQVRQGECFKMTRKGKKKKVLYTCARACIVPCPFYFKNSHDLLNSSTECQSGISWSGKRDREKWRQNKCNKLSTYTIYVCTYISWSEAWIKHAPAWLKIN